MHVNASDDHVTRDVLLVTTWITVDAGAAVDIAANLAAGADMATLPTTIAIDTLANTIATTTRDAIGDALIKLKMIGSGLNMNSFHICIYYSFIMYTIKYLTVYMYTIYIKFKLCLSFIIV